MKSTRRLLSILAICLALMLESLPINAAPKSAETVNSPNIVMTGQTLAEGVRYNVSFLRPVGVELVDFYAVVTLPAVTEVGEVLDTPLDKFVGISGDSLIWTIENGVSQGEIDNFVFTLPAELTEELDVVVMWGGATPGLHRSSKVPPISQASATTGTLTLGSLGTQSELLPVGETGVYAAIAAGVVPDGTEISVRILSRAENPPPEAADYWWCSLVEVSGLPENTSITILVPLRRPLPIGQEVVLFQRLEDGSWVDYFDTGIVAFDGQVVAYAHPGGVIATGVGRELQPQPVTEKPVLETPPVELPAPETTDAPPADANAQQGNAIPVGTEGIRVPTNPNIRLIDQQAIDLLNITISTDIGRFVNTGEPTLYLFETWPSCTETNTWSAGCSIGPVKRKCSGDGTRCTYFVEVGSCLYGVANVGAGADFQRTCSRTT